MNDRVAIIGVGLTTFERKKGNASLYELIFEVTRKALRDAGLKREDLESVVLAASDLIDGISISSMVTATAAGALLKDEIKVAEDGIFGLALAYMRVLSGDYRNSIVVSWSKCSQGSAEDITNLNFDPLYHRPFALNYVTASALQAGCYMHRYGITEEQAARVSVKNRQNSLKNPGACLRKPVTIDEVLQSRFLASPLKALDMSTFCDGACAVVLSNVSQAKGLEKVPVWVKGIGWSTDTYYMGDRDLAKPSSLRSAAERAYEMAKIDRPADQIDVAEIYDQTSFHELMAYEALNFCSEGEGGAFIDEGYPFMGGLIPVNPSGGLISSNPYFASGLVRVAEASLQLRGEAGEHQIPGAKIAMAHGTSGLAGQKNCVVILEG